MKLMRRLVKGRITSIAVFFIQAALLVPLLFLNASALAAVKTNDRGLWLTEDSRYVIDVRICRDTLCGKIYWMSPGAAPLDVKNPDPEKHATPICGLNVLFGFERVDDKNWINGIVYMPNTGKKYHATVKILPSGKAVLHGYIFFPIFGQTQVLTPVSAHDYKKCRASA